MQLELISEFAWYIAVITHGKIPSYLNGSALKSSYGRILFQEKILKKTLIDWVI